MTTTKFKPLIFYSGEYLRPSLLKSWCRPHREHCFQWFLYCFVLICCLFTVPMPYCGYFDNIASSIVVSVSLCLRNMFAVLLPDSKHLCLFHYPFQLSCCIILAALIKITGSFQYRLCLLEFWNSGLHQYKIWL
jgi:hypothetical protein